jgi:hypothetical protein
MLKKHARRGTFWHFKTFKITSIKPAANGAFQIIDNPESLFQCNLPVAV